MLRLISLTFYGSPGHRPRTCVCTVVPFNAKRSALYQRGRMTLIVIRTIIQLNDKVCCATGMRSSADTWRLGFKHVDFDLNDIEYLCDLDHTP